jgi:dTDP-4-dehydrorhamnose reductase
MNVRNGSLTWITGAGGLIGNELRKSAQAYAPEVNPRGLGRADVDLLDAAALSNLFTIEKPELIIHCAAVSRNTVCEANPDLARQTNVEVTRRLVELGNLIPFVFFSTDLVFDGTKGAYIEEDRPNPLSVYAETKVEAEAVVRQHPHYIIVRISLTGGHSQTGDRGFNEEIKNAWRQGRTLNLFIDEYRCPAAAGIVCRAVWELVLQKAEGTYHLCGSEKLSRFEIGQLLAAHHPELNPQIIAGSRESYKGPPRPKDTSMNCAKIQKLLSFSLPAFSEWLRKDSTGF